MGGNVFKNSDGQVQTQRINQTDIKPTVHWLEQLTGLDLMDNMLGSTGKKATSGDLDLAVDQREISKEELIGRLVNWCQSHRLDPRENVKKAGISVHFKTPINGNPSLGYVQTDFMFVTKPGFSKFALWSAGDDSKFKGAERNVMINSIAKSMGYKLNQNTGIVDRTTNELIADEPDEIARLLIGPRATRRDLDSVETIIAALAKDPKREEKLADVRQHFEKNGLNFPVMEGTELIPWDPYKPVDEISFMARLRDRIVNQGMIPIFEQADDAIQGGHAKGIEHFEDLVFRKGSAGIKQGLDYLSALSKNAPEITTVKWDGKPAIIWGRDENGDFILTDVAGFTAVGYDGLFKSPQQLTAQMAERDKAALAKGKTASRVRELAPLYQGLWPLLEKSTPPDFQGYVQGDLLYTSTPPEEKGAMVFKPNTIEYRIPGGSELGRNIRNSAVGIAVHTMYSEPGAPKQPIQGVDFIPVRGLLLIQPIRPQGNVTPENKVNVRGIVQVLAKHGRDIDTLFNPNELRSMQITDFPRLCVDYINSIVKDANATGFDANLMLPQFVRWLQTKVTPRKFANIREYLGSPTSNTDALAAAFSAFILLHDIKMDLLQQLDRQVPGQEGWVIATPGGVTKFVNRFEFSRANSLHNNP